MNKQVYFQTHNYHGLSKLNALGLNWHTFWPVLRTNIIYTSKHDSKQYILIHSYDYWKTPSYSRINGTYLKIWNYLKVYCILCFSVATLWSKQSGKLYLLLYRSKHLGIKILFVVSICTKLLVWIPIYQFRTQFCSTFIEF